MAYIAPGRSGGFAGFIQDVPARISQLDIVVHASTTGEPFGQVIIEAMAEQKPVVATNGGGVPEIVEDGITGILVPMGDAASMAEALTYLLANPEVAAQMGRNGRARVAAQFTIQRTARKVEAVYREVLRVPEQVESSFATANSWRSIARMITIRWNMAVACGALLLCVHAPAAQSGSATEAVPSDPGYGLYYHDAEAAPNLATRWGHHDGWEDGRRDRNHGDTLRPEDKPHYMAPTEHGAHLGITREQYNQAYRTAYARGYQHGSRL